MKAFVTGGAGFIGSHVAELLLKEGWEVVVFDNLSTGKEENIPRGAEFIKGDITDFVSLADATENIDVIFHLAALLQIQLSVEEPLITHAHNVDGTINVFEAARKNKVSRVIFSSSCAVYGDQSAMPLVEDMNPFPLSPYALHKYIGELYARLYGELYGLTIVPLRYFNVYGPRQNPTGSYAGAIAKFISLKKGNKPYVIFGDGSQSRDFVHVSDVARANFQAATSEKVKNADSINICTHTETDILKIAKLIGGQYSHAPGRPGEMQRAVGSYEKAKKVLDWEPTISIEDGIASLLS